MKVIFMGAPDFAVPVLRALARSESEIVAVYTKAPRPAGRRGLALTKTAVHAVAEAMGLRVETPPSLRDEGALSALHDLRADITIVAAYGLLLPARALEAARLGSFNLHGSLLPRWRGAAPVQRAIMAGDAETGVSIMRMEPGLDTGPIAGELRTPIDPRENAEELTSRLGDMAGDTLSLHWDALVGGHLPFAPQSDTGLAYAGKIEKSEAPIDWSAPAWKVRGHIHGLAPFPGATAEAPVGDSWERLKILRVETDEQSGRPGEVLDQFLSIACGEGAIRVLEAQWPGRNIVSGAELMRTGTIRIGALLTGKAS